MARPIWKGYISFGLVYIPVTLVTAERSKDLKFHLLDKRNKSRIHYERINDSNGKVVPWNEVTRAFEVSKNHFVPLDEEDLKKAAVEGSQTIDINNFVDEKAIEPTYYAKPYYLIPEKKGEKGYVLLRETLKNTQRAGIAKVVIRTKQYLAAVIPVGRALILNLLRFEDELIAAKEYDLPSESIKSYKITPKELTISEQLVKAMSSEWNPEEYKDDYRDAVRQLIQRKAKGLPIVTKAAAAKPETGKVIDFMSLLKKSVAEKKTRKPTRAHKKSRVVHMKHKRRAHR